MVESYTGAELLHRARKRPRSESARAVCSGASRQQRIGDCCRTAPCDTVRCDFIFSMLR